MLKNIHHIIIILIFFSFDVVYGQAGDLPPKLLYPTNQLTIQESFPSLSWTKAYPIRLDFKYEIKIVEVLSGQSPEAAILSNPERYAQKNVTRNLLLYPTTAPVLEAGKRYAWQVTAYHIQRTEKGDIRRTLPSPVYWFEMAENAAKNLCTARPYAEEEDQGEFYILNDFVLRFKFENKSIEPNKLSYKFLDGKRKPLSFKRKVVPERVGQNEYYQIALKQFSTFRSKSSTGKFYYLEAITQEGEKYFVKFTYK